jgi:hypothetical protein
MEEDNEEEETISIWDEEESAQTIVQPFIISSQEENRITAENQINK